MSLSLIKFEGKPLEKLIDAVTKGIGDWRRPNQIRKEADARAYEHLAMERAKALAKIELKELDEQFLDRMNDRTLQKEIRRQKNIENIVVEAAKELVGATVNDEPVNTDWATRFFGIVEDIGEESLQVLWAKILAGETKAPKSFSLRTLDILRNLTKEDAELFISVAKYAVKDSSVDHFILDFDELSAKHPIRFVDRLLLDELQLIVLDPITSTHRVDDEHTLKPILVQKNFGIKINVNVNTPIVLDIMSFTRAGNELMKLIDTVDNVQYLQDIQHSLNIRGFTSEIVKIIGYTSTEIKFEPIQ